MSARIPPLDDLNWGTSGPLKSQIMIVGEAWGREEENNQKPFVGASGQELNKLLAEAGIKRNDCFCTNVVCAHPPDNEMWQFFEPRSKGPENLWGLHPTKLVQASLARLQRQIEAIRPRLIIAIGNYALWALTKEARISYSSMAGGRLIPSGIMDFRGSMLWYRESPPTMIPVLPIIHPAYIMRDWTKRDVTKHDLLTRVPQALNSDWIDKWQARLTGKPYASQLRDYFHCRLDRLNRGEILWCASDIETKRGMITCMSFASEVDHGICFPLIRPEDGNLVPVWDRRTEAELTMLMIQMLTHENIRVVGQNYVYDLQYFNDHYGITPRLAFDTMVAHHLLMPGTPKGLGHLSSLYCKYHRYWKDDNKEWGDKMDVDAHYRYNAEDSVRTLECSIVLRQAIHAEKLEDLWANEMRKVHLSASMTRRGIRIDAKRKSELNVELLEAAEQRKAILLRLIPQFSVDPTAKTLWLTSPKQQKTVFYDILDLKTQYNRKTQNVSLDKKALKALRDSNPWLRRLFNLLLELRSIGTFQSHFIAPALDHDGRMRCTFNPAGTDTFRWSSSENSFGRGTNLQNIPKGDEK